MISISRIIHFCYGHRVYGHESRCAMLHGHNGKIVVHAVPKFGLDALGRVIDFSQLKHILGTWIDTYWDHGMILYKKDPEAAQLAQIFAGQKCYFLPTNPTAENLAHHLLYDICPILFKDVDIMIHRIDFHETVNCAATVSLPLESEVLKQLYGIPT